MRIRALRRAIIPLGPCAAPLEMVTAPPQFETGAGIHTGMAVVGNVGSDDKWNIRFGRHGESGFAAGKSQ